MWPSYYIETLPVCFNRYLTLSSVSGKQRIYFTKDLDYPIENFVLVEISRSKSRLINMN